MPKIKNIFKTVPIPHLKCNINFMDMEYLQGIEHKGSGFTCIGEDGDICVFIEEISKSSTALSSMPTIAHEIVHVIQILCERHGMKMENEQEHTAYLMYYLLSEVIGRDLKP